MTSRKLGKTALLYVGFVGPAGLLYAAFVLEPLLETLTLSFFKWNGVSSHRTPVGLANFAVLLGDHIFWTALKNNLLWIGASLINPMLVGLVLAVLLSNVRRGRQFYLGIYFVPVVLTLVIVGLVWGLMYNPLIGPVNQFLKLVGLGHFARGWLGEPFWVTPAIILAGNWTFFGFCTVIFLAGLQSIDPQLLESATIDGANALARFRYVIVPGLRDQINLLVVYSIIGSFKVFDIVYVMTLGGPNHSSEVIATYMYWQAFNNGRVGYGAALATVLTLVVAMMSILFLRFSERNA